VNVVMQQYYDLREAAQILQTTPDKVKEMVKKGEVRAFQDRGNLRFRAPDIDELARARGIGSDPALTPDLPSKSPPPSSGPKSGPPSSGARQKTKPPTQEPAAFIEDDEAPIGREPASSGGPSKPPSSGSKKGSPGAKVGRKPTMAQPSGPKSPTPKAASDSDVRLVAEGSDLDFQVVPDEPRSPPPGKPPSSKGKRSSKLKTPDPADSGVRIVPLEEGSDSDVKIEPESGVGESALTGSRSAKKPSDSDIRIEDSSKDVAAGKPKKRGDHPITEEIDLDEEQKRADAAARTEGGQGKTRPKPNPLNLPTSSPFELSESDVDVDKPPAKKSRPAKEAKSADKEEDDTESSSDFELTPAGQDDSSPMEISSSEVEALKTGDSDEVSLGELTGAGAAQSGINLQDPADSGISLEQGGSDEIEFELSLDSGATPKPGPVEKEESSSEFELAAEGDESPSEDSSEFELALEGADAPAGEEESSSEFELSLDVEDSGETAAKEGAEPDSDSEFELTLDAEGGAESGEKHALAGDEDKDIFETDFEVPALGDEESGSEAVVLEDDDTDVETSDFDLALDEEGAEEDSESGSQVVALEDEEEVDEAAETEARPRRRRRAAAEEEEGDLDLEIDVGAEPEEEEEEAVAAGAPAPPARWGALPALLLIPTVLIMFFVGLLSFELAGTLWNYNQPGRSTAFGIVLHPLAKYFDNTLPD
jgi:hypothetical protein